MRSAGNEIPNDLKVHGAARVKLDDVKQTLLGAGIRARRIKRQDAEAKELMARGLETWSDGVREYNPAKRARSKVVRRAPDPWVSA